VSIYGDSLTVPASESVTDQLQGSVELTIHAYPGTDLPVWIDDILRTSPSRLVLALGTNDANHDDAVGPWRTLLSELPASTCVEWPRPYRSSDRVAAFVRDMDELVATFPNVHVIDWGSVVEAHHEWLLPDGIHYGPEGTAAYASTLVDGIDVCLS